MAYDKQWSKIENQFKKIKTNNLNHNPKSIIVLGKDKSGFWYDTNKPNGAWLWSDKVWNEFHAHLNRFVIDKIKRIERHMYGNGVNRPCIYIEIDERMENIPKTICIDICICLLRIINLPRKSKNTRKRRNKT